MRTDTHYLRLFAFTLVLTGAADPTLGETLETGLVAWWRMNEANAGMIPDASGNAHALTIHGATVINGSRAVFHDDGFLQADHAADLSLLGDWTISFWAKEFPPRSGNPTNPWISKHRSFRDAEGGWAIASDANQVRATIYDSPNFNFDTPQPIPAGTRILITTTYDAGATTIRTFFNDTEAAVSNAAAAMIANNYPVVIGGFIESNLQVIPFSRGFIEDIRVYDRALLDSEVEMLYLNRKDIPEPAAGLIFAAALMWFGLRRSMGR